MTEAALVFFIVDSTITVPLIRLQPITYTTLQKDTMYEDTLTFNFSFSQMHNLEKKHC